MITLLMFLLGLIFGSFFNVVGKRLPKNESFTNDRSRCLTCNRTLQPYELIPVLSFVLQRGKCKGCQQRISYLYPLIELLTGLLFAFSYVVANDLLELVVSLLFISLLIIVLVADISYMIIPNKLLIFYLPVFIVLRIISPLDPWWSSILGAFIGFAVIALIILLSKGGMGAGDMKLMGLLGIILGFKNTVLAFILACMFGAIIGLTLMMLSLIKRKQPIPFGPYIVFGAIIAYFYGDFIVDWYLFFL